MSGKYLFYSQRCKYCEKCLELISPHQHFFQDVQFVNVNKISRNDIPSVVTAVPTLIIISEQGDHVVSGKDVFKWIHEIIMSNETIKTTTTENTAPTTQEGFLPSVDDLKEYSLNYSRIGQPNATETIDYMNVDIKPSEKKKQTVNIEDFKSSRDEELREILNTQVRDPLAR